MRDFIIASGVKVELPSGYEVALTHSEISNVKTMASGIKRKDFVRRQAKIKFTWKTATQKILDVVNALYEKSIFCDSAKITVVLRMGTAHQIHELSIISVPKYNIAFRGNLVIYSNLEVEIE